MDTKGGQGRVKEERSEMEGDGDRDEREKEGARAWTNEGGRKKGRG